MRTGWAITQRSNPTGFSRRTAGTTSARPTATTKSRFRPADPVRFKRWPMKGASQECVNAVPDAGIYPADAAPARSGPDLRGGALGDRPDLRVPAAPAADGCSVLHAAAGES